MAFTEFCCKSGGSNLNAGTLTGDSTVPGTAASFTYASGSWVQSTGVFTVASGDPASDGVAVGDFASVYPDAATVSPFVGRITARDATTITVSLTAKSGTAPVNGTTDTTLKVGGAWEGPNGTEGFPLDFAESTMTNSTGNLPRVNYAGQFDVTANITNLKANVRHSGFGSAYDDRTAATLDGGITGASYIVIGTTVGVGSIMTDWIFDHNGDTGASTGIFFNGQGELRRCTIRNMKGVGMQTNNPTSLDECEIYDNGTHGIQFGGANWSTKRCIISRNGSMGIRATNVGHALSCVFDENGTIGMDVTTTILMRVDGCDFYNNGTDGLKFSTTGKPVAFIENCNFLKNGGYGINFSGTATGKIISCGFGTGTQVNTSGDINGNVSAEESGTVNYAANVTPWTAEATGDFRIDLAAAQGTGAGAFTQREGGQSGTVAAPDIGAGQSAGGGGGGTTSILGAGTLTGGFAV